MNKYIAGVAYRHNLLTAYLKVIGHTQLEAERLAKKVGTALQQKLPKEAELGVARYRGYDRAADAEFYEIPIVIAACEKPAKAVLASLVLQGTV